MKKVGTKELLAYGVGDSGQAMMGTLIGFYQLYYFTDIMRLPIPSIAGLFFLTKLIDSACFPVFGLLMDRIPGGVGSFLKWRIFYIVPLFIVSTLLFTYDSTWSEAFRILYAYLVVAAFVIMTALVAVVYTGLVSTISDQSNDRARLSTVRFAFAFGSGTVATFSVQYLVDAFGGKDAGGYQAVAFIFSAFAAISMYLVGSFTRERVSQSNANQPSALLPSLAILRDSQFVAPAAATFFTGLFVAIRGQSTLYYIKYVMRRDDAISLILSSGTISCAIGVLLVGSIINKVDRGIIYATLMGGSAISMVAMFYVNPSNITAVVLLQCISSLLGGACSPVIFSVYSDVVDYLEDKHTIRAPALVNSMSMLSGRIGGSIGMVLTPLGLAISQYHPGTRQSDTTVFGLTLMFTLVPALLAVFSALIMLTYKLRKQDLNQITKNLSARRSVLRAIGSGT